MDWISHIAAISMTSRYFPLTCFTFALSSNRVGSKGFSAFADVEAEWPTLLKDIDEAVSRSPMVRSSLRAIISEI